MSNEKKPTNLLEEIEEASAETKAAMFKAIDAATRARHGLESADFKQKECREQHAKLEAEANRMRDVARLEAARVREKAEVEAFGHRFHAKLLAAMKAGDHNVLHVLGAAMEAAGILGPNGSTVAKECEGPRGLHDMARVMGGTANPHDLTGINSVVRGRPVVVAENIEFRDDGTVGVKAPPKVHEVRRGNSTILVKEPPAPVLCNCAERSEPHIHVSFSEKSEPAPPAYSVEERKARAKVADEIVDILFPGGPRPFWSLDEALREVDKRLKASAARAEEVQRVCDTLAPAARAQIRDAALEEADRAGMSLRQYGTVADRYDSEGLKAAARTGWNAGANEVLAAIRALKSKPAPPSSASYGDFGWALQQLLAGKRVKQGDSPRSWRMREDGALVDQNGIVMRELHMDMVLAMNWRLAE